MFFRAHVYTLCPKVIEPPSPRLTISITIIITISITATATAATTTTTTTTTIIISQLSLQLSSSKAIEKRHGRLSKLFWGLGFRSVFGCPRFRVPMGHALEPHKQIPESKTPPRLTRLLTLKLDFPGKGSLSEPFLPQRDGG